jgi:hypothetical protein
MKASAIAVSVLLSLVASCGGKNVALNERQFQLPSMTSAGGGCTQYTLGGSNGSASGGGGSVSGGLVVSQRSADDTVVVDVTEGNRNVAHRVYDEAFFHAGTVDEITAVASTGPSLLLRYWGRDADPFCTPLTLDAP